MYKIVRSYADSPWSKRTIATKLTLEEAQAHCRDPETNSRTCTTAAGKRRTKRYGHWVDGYVET